MLTSLQKHVPLAQYTSYGIGGPADYFLAVGEKNDLIEALRFGREKGLLIFILAGGNNILFSDRGFPGLVIKVENQRLEFDLGLDKDRVLVGAGVLMSKLIKASFDKGLCGLEWAGGLPGTLGGAIRGNAGCFGGEIKDVVERVLAISFDGETREYSNAECDFDYRHSRFKERGSFTKERGSFTKNQEIIWEALLALKPGDCERAQKEAGEHIAYRRAKHPMEHANCGSVFKNCRLEMVPREAQERFKDKIKNDPFPVLPSAVLISAAGLQGEKIGGAQVSEKHSNFIVNLGNASAQDVMGLINLVKEKVKARFGVELEEEIELVGFA